MSSGSCKAEASGTVQRSVKYEGPVFPADDAEFAEAFRSFFDTYRKENKGTWSDVDLARLLAAFYETQGSCLIAVQGTFWSYVHEFGLWIEVRHSRLKNLLMALSDRCDRCNRIGAIRAAIEATESLVDRQPTYFADAPEVVVCINGVFERKNGLIAFREQGFCRTHRQRYAVPISFNEHADTTEIDRFLEGCFADSLTRDLVLDILGAGLFGLGRELQRIIVLHGSGANGKGVLLQLIGLLGSGLCCSVPLEEMRTEYLRLPLATARFNLVGELPQQLPRGMLNVLKSLTGGDAISMRPVRGNVFTAASRAVHIFASNPVMSLVQRNEAIRRRLLVIPFNRTVPPEERRPRFADELFDAGRAGILLRIVEGARRVEARMAAGEEPLILPAEVELASRAWFDQTDPVAKFVSAKLILTGNSQDKISAAEMLRAFQTYAGVCGPVLNSRELKRALQETGLTSKHSDGSKWVGVRWRDGNLESMEGLERATYPASNNSRAALAPDPSNVSNLSAPDENTAPQGEGGGA